MTRRVVVTGVGLVSALGVGAEHFWESLAHGRTGLRAGRDCKGLRNSRVVGEIVDYSPEKYQHEKRYSRIANRPLDLLIGAAACASEDAGLSKQSIHRDRLGVVIGVGVVAQHTADLLSALARSKSQSGGWVDIARFAETAATLDPSRRLRHLPNIAAAIISIEHRAGGPSLTLVEGELSGLEAIIEGSALIRAGAADAVLCGGADARLDPLLMSSSVPEHLLSPVEQPAQACRPFDATRLGTVIGEGAAILLLEAQDSARRRGQSVYAEVLEGVSVRTSGAHAGLVARYLLEPYQLVAPDVVVGHGDGTVESDLHEATALEAILAPSRLRAVTSVKGNIGHTVVAAGAFNAAVGCLVLKTGFVPGIVGLCDPIADLPFVAGLGVPVRAEHVLATALNFGGTAGAALSFRAA